MLFEEISCLVYVKDREFCDFLRFTNYLKIDNFLEYAEAVKKRLEQLFPGNSCIDKRNNAYIKKAVYGNVSNKNSRSSNFVRMLLKR